MLPTDAPPQDHYFIIFAFLGAGDFILAALIWDVPVPLTCLTLLHEMHSVLASAAPCINGITSVRDEPAPLAAKPPQAPGGWSTRQATTLAVWEGAGQAPQTACVEA
jgi:hypothetical protein